jgi:hypothetical protein
VIFVMKASSRGIPREVEPAWFVSPLPVAAAQRQAEVVRRDRPGNPGPRSLIRTFTCFPLCLFVTRTMLPKGSVRCAAVSL